MDTALGSITADMIWANVISLLGAPVVVLGIGVSVAVSLFYLIRNTIFGAWLQDMQYRHNLFGFRDEVDASWVDDDSASDEEMHPDNWRWHPDNW